MLETTELGAGSRGKGRAAEIREGTQPNKPAHKQVVLSHGNVRERTAGEGGGKTLKIFNPKSTSNGWNLKKGKTQRETNKTT